MRTLRPSSSSDRGLCQPLGQLRQDAGRGLDQVDRDVLVGIDAIEPVGDELARRLVQLGGKLRAGRAGADDGDLQLLGPQRLGLGVGADAGVDQPAVEARGLIGRLERDGVLLDAGRAEIVGEAADGDDERVVAELPRRRDLPPLLVDDRRHLDDAAAPVDARHLAGAIGEAVPVGLGQVVDLVEAEVHAAGGDLVQQRLPQVRALAVDQGDRGLAAPAELVAQPRGKLQPAGSAADDDDAMQLLLHGPLAPMRLAASGQRCTKAAGRARTYAAQPGAWRTGRSVSSGVAAPASRSRAMASTNATVRSATIWRCRSIVTT